MLLNTYIQLARAGTSPFIAVFTVLTLVEVKPREVWSKTSDLTDCNENELLFKLLNTLWFLQTLKYSYSAVSAENVLAKVP